MLGPHQPAKHRAHGYPFFPRGPRYYPGIHFVCSPPAAAPEHWAGLVLVLLLLGAVLLA